MKDSPAALELFGRQFGVASLAQLQQLGVSRRALSRAVELGVLVRETKSVVRLAGYPLGFEARAMAAYLQCGPRSFLSGPTAGALLGLRYMFKRRTFITVLNRCQVVAPDWLTVSRTTWMRHGDIVTHPSGLQLMAPLRLLHQFAGQFRPHRFERAAEDAWHLGLVTPHDAEQYLREIRRQGRTGVSGLEQWLEKASTRQRPSQSGLEFDALDAVRLTDLPEPARQHPVVLLNGETRHLDLAWPDIRYGVEPGHSWWHGGDLGQRRDQELHRRYNEVGWDVTAFDESLSADLVAAGEQIRRIYFARQALFRHGQ